MKKRKIRWRRIGGFVLFNIIFSGALIPFFLFWGPFEAIKVMAVGAVETSRHPQVVRFFLSEEKIREIMHTYDSQGAQIGLEIDRKATDISNVSSGIIIEDIQGHSYKGKVMLIEDPKRVKVAVTQEIGVAGERLSDMVKNAGAIAGINAGGFYDPDGEGNGAFPDGITVKNGEIIHNNVGDRAVDFIGLDADGKLIVETLNVEQIKERNIMEGVSFYPPLVKDGKPAISGDGGWGIAPRTGIGQRADGTIIFLVIDGRQPTWSIGATLRDMMNVFLEYDAVVAANLDGGSSSEMVYDGKILNKLWNIFGERYIPTGFVVML
ncbi:MAG: phosphodiester glycosidase family protein [Desulfitobacterium sp.]|nr:phosphodiester glycosidase family protein [Desulfitobacterium sp.]